MALRRIVVGGAPAKPQTCFLSATGEQFRGRRPHPGAENSNSFTIRRFNQGLKRIDALDR
jgi:hypothetical protein